MRKFGCLILVLALASMANALTVSVTSSSGLDVVAGETVTISVTADFTVATMGFNLGETKVSAAPYATGSNATIHTGFTTLGSIGIQCNGLTPAPARFVIYDRINGVVNTTTSPEIAAGQILYSFDLTIPGAALVGDTFTVDDLLGAPVFTMGPPYGTSVAGTAGTVLALPSLTLTVPEPATIALLGLGGLLLRRRR